MGQERDDVHILSQSLLTICKTAIDNRYIMCIIAMVTMKTMVTTELRGIPVGVTINVVVPREKPLLH